MSRRVFQPAAGFRLAMLAMFVGASVSPALAQHTTQELTTPTSTVEIGAGDVTDGSYKAGEYNGLEKKGGFVIGAIDLRGGGAWNSDDPVRWRVLGTDLGLASRRLSAEIGAQGRYRFTFLFDEIRRNRSDSYQSPYLGLGTSTLALPSSWLVPTVAASGGGNAVSARGLIPSIGDAAYISTAAANNGAIVAASPAQTAIVDAAAAADRPLFKNYDIYTIRTRFAAGATFNLGKQWDVGASVLPEHKEGTKLMGTVSRNTGGDISTPIADRVDADTTQLNASLNFKGDKSFAQAAYYGSFYKNHVPFMSWENWATGPSGPLPGTVNVMSTAPDNQFNQVTGTFGIRFNKTSKLVATGSFGRNTQNASFLTDSTTVVVPVSSLSGVVVTSVADVRLTTKPAKKLTFVLGYKFDNRDNQTPVHIFQYADAGEPAVANASFPGGSGNPYGPVIAQNANASRPYSKRSNQGTADADWALAHRQWVRTAYEFQGINRSCPGSWIECADAPVTHENNVRLEYRANLTDTTNFRLGYTYGARRVPNYNENAFLALVPYANVSPVGATDGATAYSFMLANGWNGYGPTLGYAATTGNMNIFFPSNNALPNAIYANNNRISELPGLRRYFVSDRNRNRVRTQLSWQANEQLTLQGNGEVTNDTYPGATYGLQSSKTYAADVDATYTYEDVSFTLFYTFENFKAGSGGNTYTANSNAATIANAQAAAIGLSGNACDGYTTLQQRNNNNKLDPCLNWFTDRRDRVHSVGVTLGKKAERLNTSASVVFSSARSDNNVTGGNWANNPLAGIGAAAATNIAAYFIPAVALPTVSTDSLEARLIARYAVSKKQALHISYSFLHMSSADWAYEGMQFGTLSGVLPTNEQPFNYSVHVIAFSYAVTF